MSDPVTNVEIEDVLSSIRKLVSADDRPEKEDDAARTPQSDRLVLTPALRVDDAPAADSDPQENAGEEDAGEENAEEDVWSTAEMAEPADDEPAGDEAAQTSEEETAEDSAEESAGMEAESGDADMPPYDDRETHDLSLVEDAEVVEETAGADAEQSDEASSSGEGTPFHASMLTARVAEFEKAVAARDDSWEPDGTEADDNNAADAFSTLPWPDAQNVDARTPDAETPVAEASDAVSSAPEEPAEQHSADPFMENEDGAEEADIYAEEDAPAAAAGAAATSNAFLAEDDLLYDAAEAILDEEALRDLVAEIVRQELQGTLGERITRNVRKLVRREIQRALAAQELE